MGKLTTMRTARQMRDEGDPASKILLVGELNPYGGPDSNALVPWPAGCAGHRLQSKILGVDEETYLAMHRRNLCRGGWSIKDARFEAEVLMQAEWPWTLVVLLGRKVAEAFNFGSPFDGPFWMHGRRTRSRGEGFFEYRTPTDLICLPHPSGLNRMWSVAGAIDRARVLLREHAPDVAWGSCST